MRVNQHIQCRELPCADVRHECYVVPDVDVNPDHISIPSYLQAGPSFFIEKSKRRMIAEDVAHALSLVKIE